MARLTLILGVLAAVVYLLDGFRFALNEWRNWRNKGTWLVGLALCLVPSPAWATIYYMDSDVGTSGTGLSWATAWKNWSNITGLVPGDTVNISGGAVSKNYSVGEYLGASGTPGNRITYQVSTESDHNGMVNINFTATPPPYQWIYADPVGVNYNQWIAISGEVNGTQKMTVTAPLILFGDNSQGITLRYLITNGQYRAYDSDTMEVDHVTFNGPNGIDGILLGIGRLPGVQGYPANSYTRNSIHHSEFYIIADNDGSGNGDDAIQNVGNISIYNNRFIGVDVPVYLGVQHQDGIQTRGPRVRIYNNYFEHIWNYPVYGDIRDAAEPESFQVFNNVFYNNPSQNVAIGCGGVASNLDDIRVFNNTFINAGNGIFLGQGEVGCTVSNGYIVNNLFYNIGASTIVSVGGVTISNNSDGSTVNRNFVNPASDFHLTATSSAALDLGISPSYLTDITNLDRDNNVRNVGDWDLGAYEFGSGAATSPVVIARVLRWMEVAAFVTGIGWHFRKPLMAVCLAVLSVGGTAVQLAPKSYDTVKVVSRDSAVKVLTMFNHLTKPRD